MNSATAWSKTQAEHYYGFKRWGGNHFSVDDQGQCCVHPMGDERAIPLPEILAEAASMGLTAPLTIRVQDMLRKRVQELNEAFAEAIASEQYQAPYCGVFPIKVNQLREVVEEILDAGTPYAYGLEAGSKPELLAALAQPLPAGSLLICNGYKDDDYLRLAMMAQRLGKQVIIVIEQASEMDAILRISDEMGVTPSVGIRIKLAVQGEGKWATSTGDNAKFGLTASEILQVCERLKQAGLEASLRLVHFHIGSQVPSIIPIKKAVIEASRYYCELRKLGFPVAYLDVGGGLGIDYDGSRSNFESSMNYSMAEYARDVVYNVKQVCDRAKVPHPSLVSESGRAIVATHSILIIEVTDRITKLDDQFAPQAAWQQAEQHEVLQALEALLESDSPYSLLERFHDAVQKKEEAASLFTLGYLDLYTRAQADRLFWEVCRKLHNTALQKEGYIPEEIAELRSQLSEQYVCNFSVFQSLLDHWALGQLFPIAPVHRLDEAPTVDATLVDITCDSDGKISQFTDLEDIRHTLCLHPLEPGKPYYLGIFLVGAYQDIMGDLHNLFGRVNEVHVFLEDDEEDGFYIEETIRGTTTGEVLDAVQYKQIDLTRALKKQIDEATREDRVRPREGIRLLCLYKRILEDKTYLSPQPNA
jgi:arginine decarboxylase